MHHFITVPLQEVARSAGIKDHVAVGSWPAGNYLMHICKDDKNKVKPWLRDSKVDVLTLVAMDHRRPSPGIPELIQFALEQNPNMRVTLQASWLNYDEIPAKGYPTSVDRDARTGEQLRKNHASYFQLVADQVKEVNKQQGKQLVFLVPAGQARLRFARKSWPARFRD